jgi:hypothetical protein
MILVDVNFLVPEAVLPKSPGQFRTLEFRGLLANPKMKGRALAAWP